MLRVLARWPFLALVAIFFMLGAVLALAGFVFGFDLGDVDLWLEAHGGWFAALGSLLFRAFWGLILLFCVGMVVTILCSWKSEREDRRSMGCFLLAVPVIGYFAWIGMTADL